MGEVKQSDVIGSGLLERFRGYGEIQYGVESVSQRLNSLLKNSS